MKPCLGKIGLNGYVKGASNFFMGGKPQCFNLVVRCVPIKQGAKKFLDRQIGIYLTSPIERVEWFIDLLYFSFLVLTLTLVDVGVVRTFQILGTVDTQIYKWHVIFYSMEFIAPILLAYMQKRLIPLVCWIFFITGLEDTLFYLLQFGYLPPKYYGVKLLGLFSEPKPDTYLFINMLGMILMLVYLVILNKISKLRQHR